jgi:hypothetical protein
MCDRQQRPRRKPVKGGIGPGMGSHENDPGRLNHLVAKFHGRVRGTAPAWDAITGPCPVR